MKNTALLVVALLLAILLTPILTTEVIAEGPAYGGRLNIVALVDPDTMDPHKYAASETGRIFSLNIYEALVAPNPSGELIPAIAKDWEISSDSLTYTFYLRENVHFHNGRKLTAEDVKFSFERVLDPETNHPRRADFEAIKAIEILDTYTIAITLSRETAPFLFNMAEATGGVPIIAKEEVENLTTHPIGTGPFKFVHWLPNQEVKMVRNEEYWNPEIPYLDEVVFTIMADSTAALMNLRTGAIDLLPRMAPEAAMEIEMSPETKVLSGSQNRIQLMVLNHLREPLDNLKVRQAINYALDKEEIIEGAVWGFGEEIATNMSPVLGFFYNDLNHLYPYDPDTARELLKEAGYPEGFEMTLSLSSHDGVYLKIAEIVKQQLEQVGIVLELELVEWGVWLERIYAGRDYDFTLIIFTGKLDPHLILHRYQSDYVRNFFNYFNPEYDALIQEGVKIADPNERQAIYSEAQAILAQEAVAAYIMDFHLLVGARENVYGWDFYPIDLANLAVIYKK